jgi:hypothetical protein
VTKATLRRRQLRAYDLQSGPFRHPQQGVMPWLSSAQQQV